MVRLFPGDSKDALIRLLIYGCILLTDVVFCMKTSINTHCVLSDCIRNIKKSIKTVA